MCVITSKKVVQKITDMKVCVFACLKKIRITKKSHLSNWLPESTVMVYLIFLFLGFGFEFFQTFHVVFATSKKITLFYICKVTCKNVIVSVHKITISHCISTKNSVFRGVTKVNMTENLLGQKKCFQGLTKINTLSACTVAQGEQNKADEIASDVWLLVIR